MSYTKEQLSVDSLFARFKGVYILTINRQLLTKIWLSYPSASSPSTQSTSYPRVD